MNSGNYLERLLDGGGVKWTVLGDERFVEVANAARRPVKASLREPGNIPYYGANNIQDYVDGHTHDGEYVLIAEDGSASLENYSVQYAKGKFWANNHVHVVRGRKGLNTKFLYHYLSVVDFIPFLPNKDRSKLTKGEMVKIPLPIPCPDNLQKSLEIQAEIVRILDAFTSLTAELTAELTARKKQYNHYRDQLLSFEDGEVEWMPLGDIAKILNGYAFKSSSYSESGIRVIRISDVQKGQMSDANPKYYPTESADEIRKYLLDEGDLVMSLTGNAGRVAMLSKTDLPAGLNQRVACLRPISDVISTRYLFHFLNQDCFENEAMANATGGGQKNMSTTWLASYLIPVPSLQDQRRIVTILDKFDALTNSISEGLPREIALRQKQYAYYRALLLSFPKPEEVAA